MFNFFKKQKIDKKLYTYSEEQIKGIATGAASLMIDLLGLISDSREKINLLGENGIDETHVSEMLDKLSKIVVEADSMVLPPIKPKASEKTITLTQEDFNKHIKTHLNFIMAPGEISKELSAIVAGGATHCGKIYLYLISMLDAAFHSWWLKTTGHKSE